MATKGVYKIHNKTTGRTYVGASTRSVEGRISNHLFKLRRGKHTSSRMQDDFITHGESSFEYDVVCECADSDRLTAMEIAACREWKAFDPELGYNQMRPFNISPYHGRPKLDRATVRFSKSVSPELAVVLERVAACPLDKVHAMEMELGKDIKPANDWVASKKSGREIKALEDDVNRLEIERDELKKMVLALTKGGDGKLESENKLLKARVKEYEQMYS